MSSAESMTAFCCAGSSKGSLFAQRASPVQWAGPKRFHEAPISLEELPPLEAVILSHNHYDHLDYQSILALMAKTEHFLAPLGVGQTLIEWGVPAHKVHELNWWEAIDVDGIQWVATPSQHFSGRGLSDGNRSLWASWVILERIVALPRPRAYK